MTNDAFSYLTRGESWPHGRYQALRGALLSRLHPADPDPGQYLVGGTNRHGRKGKRTDFDSGINYLKKYGPYMDYAKRRRRREPIGSGITEAGCKVIFNQRLKQSGMRWNRDTMQSIIHLRTACRSRIWKRIWRKVLVPQPPPPPIKRQFANFDRTIA